MNNKNEVEYIIYLKNLAEEEEINGKIESAEYNYLKALQLVSELNFLALEAIILNDYSVFLQGQGNLQKSKEILEQSISNKR